MQEKKILIQMRDLRVGSGIASCIMKYYEYTVERGYTIDFLLNRNIDSPFVDIVKKHLPWLIHGAYAIIRDGPG